MAEPTTISGDLRVKGRIIPDSMDVPANAVVDASFSSGSPLTVQKQDHQHVVTDSQAHGIAAANLRRVIHVAHGDGTVTDFLAGIVVAGAAGGGGMSVTVDLRKNGSTILNAVITITSVHIAYQNVVGTFSGSLNQYVAGDKFEVVVVATAGSGTLPQGLYFKALFREKVGA